MAVPSTIRELKGQQWAVCRTPQSPHLRTVRSVQDLFGSCTRKNRRWSSFCGGNAGISWYRMCTVHSAERYHLFGSALRQS